MRAAFVPRDPSSPPERVQRSLMMGGAAARVAGALALAGLLWLGVLWALL